MQRRDLIAIQKMISEMKMGISLLGNTNLVDFLGNELLKRALSMTCINVGELAKVVSDETRQEHNDFPWKAIAGMRDITAHRYQTLKMEDVYTTIREEYPVLCEQLTNIISR